MSDRHRAYEPFAASAVDRWLTRHPVDATYLGQHDRDHLLDDPSRAAAEHRASELHQQLQDLDDLEPAGPEERVDIAVLRTTLSAELFDLEEVGEAGWNPMGHNPGPGLHALTSRPFAPAAERFESLLARLAAVPAYLEGVRDRLGTLAHIHTETALQQLDGTVGLLDSAVPQLAAEAGGEERASAPCATARTALADYQDWLAGRLLRATHDARLGRELFTAKLALTLDTDFEPDALLARAEDDFERVRALITAEAGRIDGVPSPDADTVRQVLDALAADASTNASILGRCRDALTEATAFVRAHGLVTVYDDPVNVVEMPEIDRGVAVAYCRPPGPLERATLATEFAVSPTPQDWSAERVRSFYREYNAHMLHNLTVHEAMPGHALQLMHSNRYIARTPVRAVFWSSSFVEGWAVYTEELMAERGYRSEVSWQAASALRMQQLKMQLRMILNAIMDIRFHCGALDEADAMTRMTVGGFQEQGEAASKWRRVQLTSTQLSTYYVGYCEVRDLAVDLRRAHPRWGDRQLHDALLSFGSPPARHIRTLLGLAE